MEEDGNGFKISTGKPSGKGPLGRFSPRCDKILKQTIKKLSTRGIGLNRFRTLIIEEPL